MCNPWHQNRQILPIHLSQPRSHRTITSVCRTTPPPLPHHNRPQPLAPTVTRHLVRHQHHLRKKHRLPTLPCDVRLHANSHSLPTPTRRLNNIHLHLHKSPTTPTPNHPHRHRTPPHQISQASRKALPATQRYTPTHTRKVGHGH